jgi:hypothetical protein
MGSHLQVKFNISTTFENMSKLIIPFLHMKFNMHPLCNARDFDIKTGMRPLLMTTNYSLCAVQCLMYLEIYSLFYKKPIMPLSTLPNEELWMYMYLHYKHLKQLDFLNIST